MKGLEVPPLIGGLPYTIGAAILACEWLIREESRAMIRTTKIDQIRIDGYCVFGDLICGLNPSPVDQLANPLMSKSLGLTLV